MRETSRIEHPPLEHTCPVASGETSMKNPGLALQIPRRAALALLFACAASAEEIASADSENLEMSVLRDDVDLIIVNMVYNDDRHCYSQIIYYDWCPKTSNFHIRDMRSVREHRMNIIPMPHPAGGYQSTFRDCGNVRTVHTKHLRIVKTQYDMYAYDPDDPRMHKKLSNPPVQLFPVP
jgi:hypothetical protein